MHLLMKAYSFFARKALHTLLKSETCQRHSTALAQRLLDEEAYYERATMLTDLTVKLGPVWATRTLIPLGPGIVALGQGDTATLSASWGGRHHHSLGLSVPPSVMYNPASERW